MYVISLENNFLTKIIAFKNCTVRNKARSKHGCIVYFNRRQIVDLG